MKIVSEQSREKLAAVQRDKAVERAAEDARRALVELTANLMRLTRGAGKPSEVEDQAALLVERLKTYREKARGGPGYFHFHEALEHGHNPKESGDRARAMEKAISGSLQVVASRLLVQPMQVAAGEEELEQGQLQYVGWRDAIVAEQKAEAKAARAASTIKRTTAPKRKASR